MAEPGLGPGRNCPLDYRYGAGALGAAEPGFEAETLYVAGGLYGNIEALCALEGLVASEPGAKLVFNGDFHWFDAEPALFREVNRRVLDHAATRGNVETEIAQPGEGAGCGCGYPEWVADEDVLRSNRIMERLRQAATGDPALCTSLASLPMYMVARVGGERIVIVHGDADSLAGWGFSQEVLAMPEGLQAAGRAAGRARARVIASSHSCLPVIQALQAGPGECVLANNGATGMPNFRGTRFGVVTRISVRPPGPARQALHGLRAGPLHVHAVPVHYDAAAWEHRFLALWPAGSAAHQSYFRRMSDGPAYTPDRALRRLELSTA